MPIPKRISTKLKLKSLPIQASERARRKSTLVRFGMKSAEADAIVSGKTHEEHLAAAITYCKTLKKAEK